MYGRFDGQKWISQNYSNVIIKGRLSKMLDLRQSVLVVAAFFSLTDNYGCCSFFTNSFSDINFIGFIMQLNVSACINLCREFLFFFSFF